VAVSSSNGSTVTLVLPVHDGTRYLAQALESALSQSRPPDEIIVIDDGSTDSPERVTERFGDRVRCFRQDRRGVPGARNRGVDLATGDFITFLDHDDLIPPDSLALRIEALAADESASYVYGTVEQFFSPELTESELGRLPDRLPTINGRVAGAVLFRREALERVGPFAETLRMGYMIDWVSRAEAAGVTGISIAETVLHRRVHATNSVHDSAMLEANYLRALRMVLRRKRAGAAAQ
jgi:glycosyltransferase involved in cell wall biosynthesis